MKRTIILAILSTSSVASAATGGFTISGGYFGGLGVETNLFLREVAASPYGVRLTTSVSLSDAFDDGRPVTFESFRQMTSGSGPAELALNLGAGLDLTYTMPTGTPDLSLDIYGGPRANYFIGTSADSGGFITVDTLQFGAGGGVAATYRLARFVNVVADAGLNLYLPSTFGIATERGSTRVEPNDPDYATVDRVVQQPKAQIRLKLGLQLAF